MTNLQAEYSKIVEQRRHNLATEKQTDVQLGETQRHQRAQEQLTDAQNQITIRGQDINSALTRARMLLDEQISDKQLANARWLEEYRQDFNMAIADLKNKTELYKADITKQNNLANQGFTKEQIKLARDKTNAEVEKIYADIERLNQELAIKQSEYDLKRKQYYNDSLSLSFGGGDGKGGFGGWLPIKGTINPIAIFEGQAEQLGTILKSVAQLGKKTGSAIAKEVKNTDLTKLLGNKNPPYAKALDNMQKFNTKAKNEELL